MDYAIVENDTITNVIVVEDPLYAEKINALPLKDGQGIGDIYEAPDTDPDKAEPDNFEQMLDAFISQ